LLAPAAEGGQPTAKAVNTLLAAPEAQTANTQLLVAPATKGNVPTLKAISDLQPAITGAASSTDLLVKPTATGGQPQTRALNTLLQSPAAQTAGTQLLVAPATKGDAPTLKPVTDFMNTAPIVIPANADLNTYVTPGFYRTNTDANAGTILNGPGNVDNMVAMTGFSLLVMTTSQTPAIIQTLSMPKANIGVRTFIRWRGTGDWQPWTEDLSTANSMRFATADQTRISTYTTCLDFAKANQNTSFFTYASYIFVAGWTDMPANLRNEAQILLIECRRAGDNTPRTVVTLYFSNTNAVYTRRWTRVINSGGNWNATAWTQEQATIAAETANKTSVVADAAIVACSCVHAEAFQLPPELITRVHFLV
jgi:hypothetical protein